MHLDGNENHASLRTWRWLPVVQWQAGGGVQADRRGRPYESVQPAKGGVPTFEQYAWAITQGEGGQHHHYKKG